MIISHHFVARRLLNLKGTCSRHSDLDHHSQPEGSADTRGIKETNPPHRPALQHPPQPHSTGRGFISGSAAAKPCLPTCTPSAPPWGDTGTSGGDGGTCAQLSRELGQPSPSSPPGLHRHSRAMEAEVRQRLRLLRVEAAEYYRSHGVPQRVEDALNTLFPQCPADLYGELVERGGEAARRLHGNRVEPPPAPGWGAAGPGGCALRRAGSSFFFLYSLQGRGAEGRTPMPAAPGLSMTPSRWPAGCQALYLPSGKRDAACSLGLVNQQVDERCSTSMTHRVTEWFGLEGT